jgi:exonuclease III
MSELIVAEWNINNRSGVHNNYKWFELVTEYLIKKRKPDVFILTEYLKSGQLRCSDITKYEDFKKEVSNKYYFCERLGDSDNGVLICLNKKCFKSESITNTYFNYTNEDDRYITPDFLHVNATTKEGIELNIIGARIRIGQKPGEDWRKPEIYKRREKQLIRILNYIEKNKLKKVIMMGDFNNGNHTLTNGSQTKYYNYNIIKKTVKNFQLILKATPDPFSFKSYNKYKHKYDDIKEDHLITDLHLLKNKLFPSYVLDFWNDANGYTNSKGSIPVGESLGVPLPDHAILEATIELPEAKCEQKSV